MVKASLRMERMNCKIGVPWLDETKVTEGYPPIIVLHVSGPLKNDYEEF
jgi:hypothetical protein